MTVCRLKLRFKCSLRCHLGRYSTKQFGLRAIVQVAFCSVISSVKLNTRNIIGVPLAQTAIPICGKRQH